MNILSLFDGMSCGRLALDRLGIKVDKYYASEIDKYAIQVASANYPDTIQIGDVCDVKGEDYPDIDLILAGSPCQGFSFAGKQLAFDDPRSALFFEFVRVLKEVNPKYFLLENVKMKKEFLDIISDQVGVEPILINSSLLSAQNRQRYYWTNVPGVEQPEDRGLVLKDILEDFVGEEHFAGDQMQKNYRGGNQLNPKYKSQANTIHDKSKKSGTICAGTHGYANGYVGDTKHKPVPDTERNRRHHKTPEQKSLTMTATMYKGAGNNGMTLVPMVDGLPDKSESIKANYAKSSKANFENDTKKGGKFTATGVPQTPQRVGTAVDIKGYDSIKRVYSPEGKSPTLTTMQGGHRQPKVAVSKKSVAKYVPDPEAEFCDPYNKKTIKGDKSTTLRTNSSNGNMWVNESKIRDKSKTVRSGGRGSYDRHEWDSVDEMHWRKLTPLECERLQTVPDNYTNHVSNTQRYKMLGNGWTVEVIAHILRNME